MEDEKNFINLPPKSYTLEQRNENQPTGPALPMLILLQDGIEKMCPFMPVQMMQPAIGSPIVVRQPCNSRCANFIIDRKDPDDPKTLCVIVACGKGAVYPITQKSAIQKVE